MVSSSDEFDACGQVFFFMVPASSFTDKLDGCQGDVFVA